MSISPEGEEVSIALVSQIECERKVHTRENVEGPWEVVRKCGRHPQATGDGVTY